jgi:hypothetical protein
MGLAAKGRVAMGQAGTDRARMGQVGTGQAKMGRFGTGRSGTGRSRKKLQRTFLLLTGFLQIPHSILHMFGLFIKLFEIISFFKA